VEAYDQLDLVAEISAALLGFIAVFLVLSRSDGRFAQSDRHFIQAFVTSASIAVVLSIMPRALGMLVTGDDVWMIASVTAIVLGSPALVLQARQQIRMSRDEAAQIHAIWHVVAWALGIASSVLFILAIASEAQTTAYYVSAVSTLVPLSLWVFIGVVFRRFF
jgi:hypothetical protein